MSMGQYFRSKLLRIKEIELDNFKSFGKQTVISLLDGFTTISGPNGSGKSNVIDSLLFALGLSSTRSMRAERLPDLINNLSQKTEAKVRVVFIDTNNQEIEVARKIKVKENGYTSTYFLNGKNSTLTDIHDELSKYNISPTGFNVIMQGDVTNIVSMSPTERRKIIDELSGVAEFDRKIDLAKAELDEVSEKVDHQKIIQLEIVTRLDGLESDKEHALKYLKFKDEKEKIQKELVFAQAYETNQILETTETELTNLESEEIQLTESLKGTEIKIIDTRANLASLELEIKRKGGLEQLAIRQELENKTGELTRIENRLSNLNTLEEEKNKTLKQIDKELRLNEKKNQETNKQRKTYQTSKAELDLKLFEKQGTLAAISAEIEVLRQNKDKGHSEITQIHLDLSNLSKEKNEVQRKALNIQNQMQAINSKLEENRELLVTAMEKLNVQKQDNNELLNKKRSYDELIATLERTIKQLDQELASTIQELETKKHGSETLKRRMVELETKREFVGGSGFGKAVDHILNAKIHGVLGTVSQLATISPKYELALEAAIGGRLNHIVVENDKIASDCINFLKTNQLGRATFIPVNKILGQAPGNLLNKPGVIDFAINLIDFDAYLTRVFQHVCGQTIVVEDMDAARRLINLARMVTLDGELLEKSGSITGGNDNKHKLHFGNNLSDDIGEVSKGIVKLQKQIEDLQFSLKELSAEANQEKHNLNEYKNKYAQIVLQLDLQNKSQAEDNNLVARLKPTLQSLTTQYEELDLELQETAKLIEYYTNEINLKENNLEKLGDKGQQTKIEKLILESKTVNHELASLENENQDINKNINILDTQENLTNENINKATAEIESLSQEIIKIQQEKPQHQELISQIKLLINELKEKVTKISDELENLRLEKEKIFETVTSLEIIKTQLNERILNCQSTKIELTDKVQSLQEKLSLLQEEMAQIKLANPDFIEPSQTEIDALKHQIDRLERKMKALEPVNMKALEEYQETKTRLDELTSQLEILSIEKINILERINSYDELKKTTFLEAYDAINQNFQNIFAELSHGHGKLELEDPLNPFNGGLIIRAQPRDKKMQRIEALSGGEKSLTALSFVFAFQRYAPAPFYAFDEVDMMLDGSNAERLAAMISRQANEAQFVVVSLRRPMLEKASHTIGVSLRSDGFSKAIGLTELNKEEKVSA